MTKRTLAALCALLVAASTLTAIAAAPAGAHGVTVRRCAYDPFAGNQCWNENVAHSHGAGGGGRRPAPSCGEGMIGTYPNCYPAPTANENHDPNADKDDDSGGGDDSGDPDTADPDTTTTTTTSSDPCGDYQEDLVKALSRAGNTGTAPDLPDVPAGCNGLKAVDLSEIAAKFGSAIANAVKRALEYYGEASTGEADAYANLGQEIERLWDKTPVRAKAFITGLVAGAGCVGLAVAIAKSTTATMGSAAPAWIRWVASPAGKTTIGVTCGAVVDAATVAVYGDDAAGASSRDSGGPLDGWQDTTDPDELESAAKAAAELWMKSGPQGISKEEITDIQNRRDCYVHNDPYACAAIGQ